MNRTTAVFSIIFASIAALAFIVFAALSIGALGWLLASLIALCLLAIWVSRVGVDLFSRFVEAANKRDLIRNDYRLAVLKLGYQPTSNGYELLPAPTIEYEPDIPVSIAGVSPQALMEYRVDAENLVVLSNQLIIQGIIKDKSQIAPFNRARKCEYFFDVAVWTRAVQYLLANHMAEERTQGKKHLGTFCMAGTVEQLYQRLHQN